MALTVELKGAPALRQELGPARLLPGPRGEAATVAVGSVARPVTFSSSSASEMVTRWPPFSSQRSRASSQVTSSMKS